MMEPLSEEPLSQKELESEAAPPAAAVPPAEVGVSATAPAKELPSPVEAPGLASAPVEEVRAKSAPDENTVPLEGDAPEESPLESACVLDGSKLILRIAAPGKPFQVDHGLKILFADGVLKRIERGLAFSTYVTSVPNVRVVIDAGGVGYRFVPLLPAMFGGVIYTRDGASHVVLSGSGAITRTRVSATQLPTRIVNKFVSSQHFQSPATRENDLHRVLNKEVFFPWSTLGHVSGQGGVVFVRCDESMYSQYLGAAQKGDLCDGRPVAWTAGMTFQPNNAWLCFKRLCHVAGPGTIWIDNGKAASNVVMS